MDISESDKPAYNTAAIDTIISHTVPQQVTAADGETRQLRVVAVPDIHLLPRSMWDYTPYSAAALAGDRKMFAESEAIFEAILADIVRGSVNAIPSVARKYERRSRA